MYTNIFNWIYIDDLQPFEIMELSHLHPSLNMMMMYHS